MSILTIVFQSARPPFQNLHCSLMIHTSLCTRYLAKSLMLILPYFPTGTMERVEEEGQIATAMTMARMIGMKRPLPTITLRLCHTLILLYQRIELESERFKFQIFCVFCGFDAWLVFTIITVLSLPHHCIC